MKKILFSFIYDLTIYNFLDSLEPRRAFYARTPIYVLFNHFTISHHFKGGVRGGSSYFHNFLFPF